MSVISKQPVIPTVSKSAFIADVNNGMKREQLAEKYSITTKNVNEIAKLLNIKIKKNMKPKFILVDDQPETITVQ